MYQAAGSPPDPHDLTDREMADILDPAEDPPDAPRTTTFPGETFRVLKERETREYGEYRTQRLVLAAWDALHRDQSPTNMIAHETREYGEYHETREYGGT